MRAQRLGCLTPVGILAGLVTLVVIVGAVAFQGGAMFSPGELSEFSGPLLGGVASHAELGGDCAACHTAPWDPQGMTSRCLECHTQIQAELLDPASLHGGMAGSASRVDCLECHTEHNGPLASLTHVEVVNFPHDRTGFSLAAHAAHADGSTFACADCHEERLGRLNQAVCENCHQEIAPAFSEEHPAFGTKCLACHDGVDTYGASFEHALTRFPLEGKHGEAACVDCHAGMTTLAQLRETPQDCAGCHAQDDAHAGQMGNACGECHTSAGWLPASFDHTQTIFPLIGKHQAVECRDCHAGQPYKDAPTDCFSCHAEQDAHSGQLGTDCAACHSPNGWVPALFDHNQSAFPLTGAHLTLDCSTCHTGGQYKGLPVTCSGCHAKDDAHQGQFGLDCSACHTTTAWKPATFDHSKSAFPLTGAHQNLACSACHANGRYAGTPSACAGCHADPAYHAGLFGANCSACHNTSSWLPAAYNGPHSFPMNHGGAGSCRECHTNSLSGWTCYTCHSTSEIDNKHREEGISDYANCLRCHPDGREGGEGGSEGGGGEGGDD